MKSFLHIAVAVALIAVVVIASDATPLSLGWFNRTREDAVLASLRADGPQTSLGISWRTGVRHTEAVRALRRLARQGRIEAEDGSDLTTTWGSAWIGLSTVRAR